MDTCVECITVHFFSSCFLATQANNFLFTPVKNALKYHSDFIE